MKRISPVLTLGAILFCLGLASQARAFIHPCVPTSLEDLDTIKANLDKEPWKSGYANLANASTSQLSWHMEGPCTTVSRTPDINLTTWKNDMTAVYNLARMWYLTGNNAYAQKAHDILLAWATTQTSFGGQEMDLSLGDFAVAYAGGADILRGTWPGWTAADTATVKNYFENVTWPATIAGFNTLGPANKGMLYLEAGIAVAAFCDDTAKFNHCIDLYRTCPASGLYDTLPTGEMGETGRDEGHSYGTLLGMAVISEIAWKQGIDLYSDLDNRLLACGEYYARNTLTSDNPFVPFGAIDYNYYANNPYYYTATRTALYIIQNAYKNRLGLPTPWIDRKLQEQGVYGDNFMYAKTADFSIATPQSAVVRPPVSPASSGLTLTTLGSQTAGRSVSYANGVWTMTGLGNTVWTGTGGADDCQFAYQAMTGDCAMVVRVTSATASGSNNGKVGLMMRDSLSATVSQRAWIGIVPNASPNLMESRQDGWTDNWGGSNWARRSQGLPPGMPYWLKIERRGGMIATYTSQDGTSWAGNINSYYANLPATVYVGLFLSSGTTTTETATFDHVAFTGGSGGLVTTPDTPATLFASGSSKAITVRWLPSFGATAYDLLRSTTSGSGYTVIASDLTADKTSYVDTTASAGTTYYYVAEAKNSAGTSGNSPEFYAALLPAPMVNLAITGTANDSANSPANAGNAFDQNPASQWFYTGTSGWLQYDFGAGNEQVVKRYTVTEADTISARDPKDWTFQGSQDGANWTSLDTQTNQSFAYTYQQLTYNLTNTTAYRYYRINVTANNGDSTFLHIGDLGLWGDSGRTIPDGRYVLVSRHSNKVMDDGNRAGGTPLVQRTFTGGDSQQWDIAWQGNGRYRATAVGATSVMDNGGTSTPGADLVTQPANGGTSQLWTVLPDRDGLFRITSANSGLVADVSGGSTADGTNIIQSTYNGGDSQLWMPGSAATPQPVPPAPTSLTATAPSISQVNLSWATSPGAISYNIKRSTVSGGPYTTVADGVNTTSDTDTGLYASTTYYYVVSAINGSGESADSYPVAVTTPTAPPAAPTGLTTIQGTNQVVLSWTATGGATSYGVKRATTSGGPYTTVATGLTGTTYDDTSITNGTAYYYVIFAVNAVGTGSDSAEVTLGAGSLVAHLKFDETGGTLAADSGGGGHDATLVNGPTFSAGYLDNALDLPATSSQYATLPGGIVSGLTDFTISTWIKVGAFTTWSRIFDFGTGTNNYMFLAAQGPAGAGRPRFAIRSSSVAEQSIDSSVALTAGTWAHIAVTRSGNTVSLYVNGTLAGSATITISPSDLGFTTQNYLGASQFGDPSLNASLDDFRIYPQALSSTDISALANPPAGAPTRLVAAPGNTQATLSWNSNATSTYTVKRSTTSGGPYTTVATGLTAPTYTDTGLTNGVTYYYVVGGANAQGSGPDSAEASVIPNTLALQLKFDETAGTVAADSSGRAADATLVNGPAFVAGEIGNAINLSAASSQYATLPSGIVSGLSDFTVSTWIKVNAFATWQRIFDFGTGTSNYMFLTTQYSPTSPNNAKLRFGIRVNGGTEQDVSSTVALSTGVWTHVAVARSGNTVSLYVNGSLAGSGTITTNPSDLGATTQNYLGKSQFNDPYLAAALDDFRIYAQALSSGDITALATVPPGPTGLAATLGSGQVSLSWSAVSGASAYNVKRSTTQGGAYALLGTTTSTSYSDTTTVPSTSYYYVVSANTSTGESTNSAEASALTVPASPTGLTTTSSNGQVDLAWTASTGATGYTILRATSPNGPFTTLASGVAGTSYTDTTALPGWTYTYAVSAGNTTGQSQASASSTTTGTSLAVSWLKLDETTGTTAADATGNANVGTLVNAPAWIGGDIGNALGLNGTNQYVTLPNGVASDLHDFTITAWVYWNGGGNWQRVFDFGTGTTTYMFLSPKNGANGKLRFAITTGGNNAEQMIDGTAALPTGGWHHVAVTLAGSTGTLFVDGVQVGQNTAMTLRPSDLGVTTQNRIGRSQYNDPYLNGRVDDFRLYAGALSTADIAALAAPIQTTGLTATGGSGQITLAWNTTYGASSYTVRRASTSGGAYTVVASGLTGTSYTDTGLADGTTYDYVVTPADNSGDGANSAEVSATTIPSSPGTVTATPGSGQVALSWSASTGATGYDVLRATSANGGYTTLASGLTGTSYTDTGLTDGTAYYYAVVATNGSGSSASSTQVNAVTAPPAPTGLTAIGWNGADDLAWTAASGATSYTVKRATTSGGPYATVAGGVTGTTYSDTTAVNGTTYDYVVSATNAGGESADSAEASATFTQPVAYLKFDETSGTSAADSSGNNWTGTLVNGPLWSAGRANNTVDLDGSNDYVTLPTGVVNGLTDCTITLWANLDLLSTWSRLFDFGTGTTVNMFLTPKNGNNNHIRFAITTGGGNGEQRIDGTNALPVGGWHHVAVTLSGSTGTLYVDGVQVGQNTAMTLTPSSLGATTQNRIGRSQYNDPYLMGRIDEFRIYDRALSASEVASLMATSPAGLVSAPASLIATAGTGQAMLSWTAVSGATGYDVMRSTINGGPYLAVATDLTTTTYTNTGLTAGTTYYYVIVAHTATSESPDSPVASATAQ